MQEKLEKYIFRQIFPDKQLSSTPLDLQILK